MSDNNVTWVPVIDSRGFDRDQDGNVYAYCRAVAAPTWSQEPPTEAGQWWVWFPGDDEPVYVMVAPMDGMLYCKSVISLRPQRLPTGVWWMPATVPQPPTGEVGP